MRPLKFSINITLDGCVDHLAGIPDEDTHRHATNIVGEADVLLFGRVLYEMMEETWRPAAKQLPPGMPEWMAPFAKTIDAGKKYVVSDTLKSADWNAEIIRGPDLEKTVRALKRQPGKCIYTGGVTLPLALAKLGLIDEYEFLIHPRIAGHGPTPFAGLTEYVDLKLVSHQALASGAVAVKYVLK